MITKHTPGPWAIRPGDGGPGDEVGRRFPDKAGRMLWDTVAHVRHPGSAQVKATELGVSLGTATAVRDANARLIAAAPELLRALEEIAAGRLDHEHDPDDFHNRARTIARAAIAKARGES